LPLDVRIYQVSDKANLQQENFDIADSKVISWGRVYLTKEEAAKDYEESRKFWLIPRPIPKWKYDKDGMVAKPDWETPEL
jgi:hypothetical protein